MKEDNVKFIYDNKIHSKPKNKLAYKGICATSATKHLKFEVLNVWVIILQKLHSFRTYHSRATKLSESVIYKENKRENRIHFPVVEMKISP